MRNIRKMGKAVTIILMFLIVTNAFVHFGAIGGVLVVSWIAYGLWLLNK